MSQPKVVRLNASDKVIIGRPAHPPADEVLHRIGEKLRGDVSIAEAYLPQYFMFGLMPSPKLLLALVVDDAKNKEGVAHRVNAMLANIDFESPEMDVWLMDASDPLLPAVRRANCRIVLS